ncbi:MAG: hypothetical protein QW484_02925 [Candidatus Pacearchaeota archaeon]
MKGKIGVLFIFLLLILTTVILSTDVKAGATCQERCDSCAVNHPDGKCYEGFWCLSDDCGCDCNAQDDSGLWCRGVVCNPTPYRYCSGNSLISGYNEVCYQGGEQPPLGGCFGQTQTIINCTAQGKICYLDKCCYNISHSCTYNAECCSGYCFEGYCSGAFSCTINSVTISPQCSGGNPTKCEQGENISITVSYSGSCPSTSYLQVDAIDENNECIIERVGGDMQGMSFTCTSSPCTGIWQIPSIPNECKGKQMFAWSAGLYNNPDYQPNHYVTGKQANVPPGFPQNWTFIEAAPPQPVPGCYIASSCSSNYKAIFSVSDVTNAHGSIYNNSPTDYKRVCCPGTNISYGEYVVGAGGTYNNQYVLRFSNYTNAHVQQNDKTDYTYAVKIKKTDGNYATCTYQDTTCPSTHPMCIVSISGDNNAHVANCSGTGAYTRKVCCDLSVGGVPSTACNITNASIKQYCGNDGVCNASIDKIELNISVENYQNCINPNNGWIHYLDGNCEEDWFINNIMRQGNNYLGNWTVNTANPQYCLGETVKIFEVALWNSTQQIAFKYASGSFGQFTFAGTILELYRLFVETCGDNNVPPDGSCENWSINGSVAVNGTNWGNSPQFRDLAEGIYNISFGPKSGWYKPGDIFVNLPPNTSVLGIYTKQLVNYALVIVRAKNETGHYIGAQVDLYKGTTLVNSSINVTSYNYSGTYPVNFEADFKDVSGYVAPENLTFTIYNPGIYVFEVKYKRGVQVLPCNVINASITALCGGGNPNECEQNEKIRLNITVENIANCLNVNKIEIDASSSYAPPPGGGISFSTPTTCTVTMANTTPIQIQGNRFIANWTVSISNNCAGKIVYAHKAKVYNGTNNKIGEKSGSFGSFKFADQISGCYCIYNNQQYSCGSCVSGSPYDCKDVNGQGQMFMNCTKCNNCPSGSSCNTQTGQCMASSDSCHTNQANSSSSSCHGVTNSLCFWNYPQMLTPGYVCEACFAVNGKPQTCSDYKNQSACVYETVGGVNNDRCNIGPSCSGAPQGATNCYCYWDSVTNSCGLSYTIEQPQQQHCNLNIITSECDDPDCGTGKRKITYDYSNQTGYSDCTAQDSSECVPCGLLFRPLPFFEWWQAIVVVGLVVVVYAFMLRRKYL